MHSSWTAPTADWSWSSVDGVAADGAPPVQWGTTLTTIGEVHDDTLEGELVQSLFQALSDDEALAMSMVS